MNPARWSRRRQVVTAAALLAFVAIALWRGADPPNPCSPGYREGTTGNLQYTAGPCSDSGNPWYGHQPTRCVPFPGVRPSASPFQLPSCVPMAKEAGR